MTALHKEIYGQGEPLVMLHGWAMHTAVWRQFALQLAQHHQVICVDLPGHGLSESVVPYTMDIVVDAIVNEFPEQACVIVGWSLGGNIALRLAEKYPQRIKSLVLIASNPHFIQTETWPGMSPHVFTQFTNSLHNNSVQTLFRFMSLQVQGHAHAKLLLKQINKGSQECAPPTKEVLICALSILQTLDQRDALRDLKLPVLMMIGVLDALVPAQVGKCCQSLQPNMELYEIEGAGHLLFITEQEQVVKGLLEFLLKHNAPEGVQVGE